MTPRSIIAALAALAVATACQDRPDPASAAPNAAVDRDLFDVTVPRLRQLYADRKYTVTDVVKWHLGRIDRYNGVYGAIETVLRDQALAAAKREDAERGSTHGPLWGVPIVIKANTSVKGQVTTAGWEGFTRPGHELIAPKDATIVAKLEAAGAIIVGLANMPDLANSDTNRSSSFGRTGNAYDVRFSPERRPPMPPTTSPSPLKSAMPRRSSGPRETLATSLRVTGVPPTWSTQRR